MVPQVIFQNKKNPPKTAAIEVEPGPCGLKAGRYIDVAGRGFSRNLHLVLYLKQPGFSSRYDRHGAR
jgi:hypothetical protein